MAHGKVVRLSSDREALKADFLARAGVAGAERQPLPGDASTRRYERLRTPDGRSLMLMDAPPAAESAPCGPDASAEERIAAGYNASGAQRAARTIDWLHEHGYTGLSQSSIVVLTDSALKNNVDRDAVRHHFDGKASSLVEVPFDVTCSNGGVLRLDDVSAATRLAWLKIAAEIAARF